MNNTLARIEDIMLPVKALKLLQPFFLPNMNVIQLRDLLSRENEILLAQHTQGEDLERITSLLGEHAVEYRLHECEIEFLGRP